LRYIELTKGQRAIVDDDVYAEINNADWYARWSNSTQSYHAQRKVKPDNHVLTMARVIACALIGYDVRHINGDTLDNRKENLLSETHRCNCQSRHKVKSSIYPGVHWNERNSKWRARIFHKGKNIHLGYHINEEDAYREYVKACDEIKLVGDISYGK